MAKAREAEDGELPLDFTSCRSLVALGSTAKGEGQTLDYRLLAQLEDGVRGRDAGGSFQTHSRGVRQEFREVGLRRGWIFFVLQE